MITGALILGVVALPWYTWLTWKDDSNISIRFIFIIIGTFSLVVPGFLINLNLQDFYNTGYYSNQLRQQALYAYNYNLNADLLKRYSDSVNYPKMKQLHSMTTVLLSEICGIQKIMIDQAESETAPVQTITRVNLIDPEPGIKYELLSRPFEHTANLLTTGSSLHEELYSALTIYKSFISEILSGEDFQKYEMLLELAVYIPADDLQKDMSLMSALHSMELLKNSLVSFESYALRVVASNRKSNK
jgi:hypothetical protein